MAVIYITRQWGPNDRLGLQVEIDEDCRPEALAMAKANLLDAYREALTTTLDIEGLAPVVESEEDQT